MKSIYRKVLIKIEKEEEDTISTSSGFSLHLNTKFSENYEHTRRYGYVAVTNPELEKQGIKVGTKLYFHHFVVQSNTVHKGLQSNAIEIDGEKYYEANLDENVYLYENDGERYALDNYVFIERYVESEKKVGDLLISKEKSVNNLGIVKYLNKEIEALGVKVGDVIIHEHSAFYKINIGEEEHFRVQNRYILGVIRDGKIVPLFNRCILKDKIITDTIRNGLYIPQTVELDTAYAEVVHNGGHEEVAIGDTVVVFKRSWQHFVYNDELFRFAFHEHILAVVDGEIC